MGGMPLGCGHLASTVGYARLTGRTKVEARHGRGAKTCRPLLDQMVFVLLGMGKGADAENSRFYLSKIEKKSEANWPRS